MVKVKVDSSITNKPKYFLYILIFAGVLVFIFKSTNLLGDYFNVGDNTEKSSINSNSKFEDIKTHIDNKLSSFEDCTLENDPYSCFIELENDFITMQEAIYIHAYLSENEKQRLIDHVRERVSEISKRLKEPR